MRKTLIGILGVLILIGGIALDDGAAQTYTISGRITDSRDSSVGIGGVTMNGLPDNPTTDANGYYSVIVPPNWSGIVKPQKIGYAIFPFSTEYVTMTSNQIQDYAAVLLPKVALSMQPAYNLGDPINITMTLENQGSDFFTLQGFMNTNFALFLQFTDPDNKLITSNYGVGRTPPPPASVSVITPDNKVEQLQVDYVENVPVGWVLSMPFNALNYYTLTRSGNYLVKAKTSVRVYPRGAVSQTDPPYAAQDSGSSGDVESNTVTFTLSQAPTVLDHISIYPLSATIIAGGSQSYTAEGFNANNQSLGDMTGATAFSISPNGNCTGSTCTATVGGEHTVTGNNSGRTAIASLQVNPGTLNSITISPSSATITAGGSQVYTATGYDQYNNSLGNVTGATTFSISPDGSCTGAACTATISGPHIVTGNDNGKTATASLQVNPGTGVAAKLAFGVQPTNTTVGVAISPPVTVRILDRNGNLTSSTASVILAIGANPGGGTLSGTKTVAALAGVATFNDLSINKVGTGYTLKASSSGLTGATSSKFNITIYNFTGFFSPVENPPTVNMVTAVSTIPVKWRITDTKGVGISDRSSFVSLTSSKVSCTNWTGPKDTRSESTQIQYIGDGYWQYNWSTSKDFSDTCRIMTIKLKDGTEHKARFKFVR